MCIRDRDIPSLNILPPDLSVNQAHILSPTEKEENKWVDLMMLTENTSFMNMKAKLECNLIKGHRSTVLHGQEAVVYQKKRQQEQDSIVLVVSFSGIPPLPVRARLYCGVL